jgi:outer membrane protein
LLIAWQLNLHGKYKEKLLMVQSKRISVILSSLIAVAFLFSTTSVFAEAVSIAVLDMQKVVLSSKLGKEAQKEIEKRVKELEKTFKADEETLIALQNEIEKKSSVWSEEKKQDKSIEFQKLRRDLRAKQDDANVELKQLQEKQLAPIFKELEAVVKKFAEDNKYSMILPSQAVLYAIDSVDITDKVTQALNAKSDK